MNKFIAWLQDLPTFHERLMCHYLRRRGWVVFYLEPQSRECRGDTCWMKLYREVS